MPLAGADGVGVECLALAADDYGRFAGCRHPPAPGCLCTLEAVSLALRLLEPSAEEGEAVAEALLRPMLAMAEHQAALTPPERVPHRRERPGYVEGGHASARTL